MPKFASELDWQRAQHLMQPALIRIIDNIRKQLDVSEWQGSYHTDQLWPEDTSEVQKAEFNALQQQLNSTQNVDEADVIEQQLAQLPAPLPIYALELNVGNKCRAWICGSSVTTPVFSTTPPANPKHWSKLTPPS